MPVNPFGQGDPLAPASASGWGASGQGAGGFGQGGGSAAADYAVNAEEYDVVDIAGPTPAPAPAGKSGKLPSKDLTAREAALKKREAEIARRESALGQAAQGTYNPMLIKNFPKCYPMVHHDIKGDIPVGKQGITRAGFFIFMLTAVAFTYNLAAVAIAGILGAFDGGVAGSILFAIIYFLIGIPGAWVMWYARLYNAMRTDGAVSFATFFFIFMVHIAFCGWSAVAPDLGTTTTFAHVGFFPAIDFVDKKKSFASILYFIGTGIWGFLCFVSVMFLFRVYSFFRTSGSADAARQQAVQAGVQMAADDIRNGNVRV